jgi:glycosyltransferase involved in cell wall biosynthesis
MIRHNKTVSVIIRFHHGGNISFLQKAVESVAQQTCREIEIVLCGQGLSRDELSRVRVLLNSFRDSGSGRQFQIHNLPAKKGADLRAPLMNVGIKRSKGRYIAFLDYDDTVLSDAYSFLKARLVKSGATVAVGGSRLDSFKKNAKGEYELVSSRPFSEKKKNLLDLFCENFIPIHSFMIDRRSIKTKDLLTDETLKSHEDYYVLLRLASAHRFDLEFQSRIVCVYNYWNDGTNFTPSKLAKPTPALERKQKRWEHGRMRVNAMKSDMRVTLSIEELRKMASEFRSG